MYEKLKNNNNKLKKIKIYKIKIKKISRGVSKNNAIKIN